ncbi:Pre-rRNA-processing protein IPI1 like [Verticillium longisporum]|nr:Pre-rRNA-processing protein IPI1 like [Verticillium longisporum]
MRKKKEKAKDFQLKVGKAKAKPANFTDTSFKSKSISMGQQSLSTEAPETAAQFKHSLSLATTSRSEKTRREALANLTTQVASGSNPIGTATVLAKVLPLISDAAGPVRLQLLKLMQELPEGEIRNHAERCVMYVRAGMTHLSVDISNDALSVLDWLLTVAPDETVSCPGGWVKTINSFCALMGWSVSAAKGWTAAPKAGLKAKDAESRTRQFNVLTKLVGVGLKAEASLQRNANAYWDSIYRVPRTPHAFAYLNLFGSRRDEEAEMYEDRESRQRVFNRRFEASFAKGIEQAKKEGGRTGRIGHRGIATSLYCADRDDGIGSVLESAFEGAIPGDCKLKNANWCGKALKPYDTDLGCWAAVEACFAQGDKCFNPTPPTGVKNCDLWNEKLCKVIQSRCEDGEFEGPPEVELEEVTNPAPGYIPKAVNSGAADGSYEPRGTDLDGEISKGAVKDERVIGHATSAAGAADSSSQHASPTMPEKEDSWPEPPPEAIDTCGPA